MTVFLALLSGEDERRKFVHLYTQYNEKIFSIAYKILNNHYNAEDASQKTWVKVIEHLDDILSLPPGEIEPYIVVIAKNVSLNMMKKDKKMFLTEEFEDIKSTENAESYSGFDYLIEMIRQMPPLYRGILEMKFVLEWQDKEIAHFFHIKPSTAAMRISRGRKILMDRLKQEGFFYE